MFKSRSKQCTSVVINKDRSEIESIVPDPVQFGNECINPIEAAFLVLTFVLSLAGFLLFYQWRQVRRYRLWVDYGV